MELNIEIGPYILSRRTEYSRFQLFSKETGENITEKKRNIYKKLLSDYENQLNNPDDYFVIDGDKLVRLKDVSDISFLFIPKGVKIIDGYACGGADISYVHFPDSVNVIKESAFSDCGGLITIDLPDTITHVGSGAFSNCEKLNNVKLSRCITTLFEETFMDCTSLDTITLPKVLDSIEDYCFAGCAFKEIKIPDNVSEIWACAFMHCDKLEHIELPKNLKIMGSSVFYRCERLNELILPDGLISMRNRMLSLPIGLEAEENPAPNTPGIKNINIPRDLSCVVDLPFEYSKVKSLTFNYNLEEIDYVRSVCEFEIYDLLTNSNIDTLIIDNSVKTITPDAFKYSGDQISKIDYLGTKSEFERFKYNNTKLFKCLSNVKEINLINEKKIDEDIVVEDIIR